MLGLAVSMLPLLSDIEDGNAHSRALIRGNSPGGIMTKRMIFPAVLLSFGRRHALVCDQCASKLL